MKPEEERAYAQLSPFEIKDKLIALALDHSERMMLNAGRGNPNWLALAPRQAFVALSAFALKEAESTPFAAGLGAPPHGRGIDVRWREHAGAQGANAGVALISRGIEYARDVLGIAPETFIHELADAALGANYPYPPRMLSCCERVVRALLERELLGGVGAGKFDLFAVEGATAAIAYLFNSLSEARLLSKGDRIALGVPIFTPYLEVPQLNDYELVEIEVRQDEHHGWQYPEAELDRLCDPKIKAFFLVNPSNPTATRISKQSLDYLGRLIRERRPDLIVISDDVYATFVPEFRSVAAVAPRNTILVYSWSKFWGATGWRLGVIAMHEDNVLDARLRDMPESVREVHRARYGRIAVEPLRIKFIDRMVADSRAVGLNHTAGLSAPQQAQMALFALHILLDDGGYTLSVRDIVRRRHELLCKGAGIAPPADANNTHYYATLDVPLMARERHGAAFAEWLVTSHEPIDFVVRLAEDYSVVVLDGGGFDAPKMSLRVSLANLPDNRYLLIGQAIRELLGRYHAEWSTQR